MGLRRLGSARVGRFLRWPLGLESPPRCELERSSAREAESSRGRGKRLSELSDSSPPVRVVCLTGMPGCGKEEALAVAQTLGFAVVRMGDVVREEALRRGLPISDTTVGGMAHAERQIQGMGVWAERTLPRISGEGGVVDGLRGRAEVAGLLDSFGDRVCFVAVHAARGT